MKKKETLSNELRPEAPSKQRRCFIEEHFTTSNMSDSKWRKLFLTLGASDLKLTRCCFKFIGQERIYIERFPETRDLRNKIFDDYLGVRFRGYAELEWIEIPKQYQEPTRDKPIITQNIEGAYELLQKTGQFEMELSEAGLKIYGYS